MRTVSISIPTSTAAKYQAAWREISGNHIAGLSEAFIGFANMVLAMEEGEPEEVAEEIAVAEEDQAE